MAVAVDVSRLESVTELEHAVRQRFGGTDVLMNNAGIQPGSGLFGPREAWERVMAVNLWGSDKNFDVYLQRIEQSFSGKALILPTGRPGNVAVFGFKREPGDLRISSLRARAKELEKTHKIEFLQFVEKLAEHNESTSNRIFMKSDH